MRLNIVEVLLYAIGATHGGNDKAYRAYQASTVHWKTIEEGWYVAAKGDGPSLKLLP